MRAVHPNIPAAKAGAVLDARRVYLVGSGAGAHAVLATAVRHLDRIAAAAVGARKTSTLIPAGTRGKELRIARHAVSGLKTNR